MQISLTEIIHLSIKKLERAGIDNPSLDTRILVCYALDCDRVKLLVDGQKILSDFETDKINQLIERRVNREPVARIIGKREFWGLPFDLNEATLEPRPDTETLVKSVIKTLHTSPSRVLDLGTGTGCILLSLLHEFPNATGMGVDIAPRAVEQAKCNAEKLDLSMRANFMISNWTKSISEKFDLIVSNPPYIPDNEIDGLMPEVSRFDPHTALAGGDDGLDPYRQIIQDLDRILAKGGLIAFEVGAGEALDVKAMLEKKGLVQTETHKDLSGIDRCVTAFQC